MVAAASFDDMVAITLYTIFSSVAITGGPNNDVAWQIATGPLQLIFGAAGGFLGAAMCACTVVWNQAWKRAAIVFTTSMLRAPQAGSPLL